MFYSATSGNGAGLVWLSGYYIRVEIGRPENEEKGEVSRNIYCKEGMNGEEVRFCNPDEGRALYSGNEIIIPLERMSFFTEWLNALAKQQVQSHHSAVRKLSAK